MEEKLISRLENSCLIHEENGEKSRPLASYFNEDMWSYKIFDKIYSVNLANTNFSIIYYKI